eukprot:SAG31_NODE_22659_length_520_cov_1.342043_1_plen_24_part_01
MPVMQSCQAVRALNVYRARRFRGP